MLTEDSTPFVQVEKSPNNAPVMESSKSKSLWTPYGSIEALPFPGIDTSKLNSMMRKWYIFRWKFTQPLLKPVVVSRYFRMTVAECFIVYPISIGILVWSIILFLNDKLGSSGTPPVITMAFAFFFACHNSIITFLTGVPFERALWYHKLAVLLTIITGTLHGIVFIRFGEVEHSSKDRDLASLDSDESGLFSIGDRNITKTAFTGFVLMFIIYIMSFFSLNIFRRKVFEFFHGSHWIFVLLAIGFAIPHGAGGILLGAAAWLLDVIYRYFLQAINVHPRQATVNILPANVIQLAFKKEDFHYRSGQYIFLCIPKVSCLQWHPFSISSAAGDDKTTVHIRVLGNWTKKLYELCNDFPQQMDILMEGPYGEPSVDVEGDKYTCFLMISGGIGITPLQSITNDLLHQFHNGRPVDKCWFVWSVRDLFIVDALYNKDMLSTRLPHSFIPDGLKEHCSDTESPFYTEFFLTKAREETEYNQANISPILQDCLRFGRPNLENIILEMHKIAHGKNVKKVAVLVCGPKSMVESVYTLSKKHSTKDVQFDVHSETFEF